MMAVFILFCRFLFVAAGGDIAIVCTSTPGLQLGRAQSGDAGVIKRPEIM